MPANLLGRLVSGDVDLGLVPVIDYQTSPVPLTVVPVGGIGSVGRTLTVRVFSRCPLGRVTSMLVDGESHTSVALLKVVFKDLYGTSPAIRPLPSAASSRVRSDAVLLIGDKVVSREPSPSVFPFQLDLGEAWRELTGLPFVFAVWMARKGAVIDGVPELLAKRLQVNLGRIPEIVGRQARPAGWPPVLAERYLGSLLSYRVGPEELAAIEEFWSRCHRIGLLDELRPLELLTEAGPDVPE